MQTTNTLQSQKAFLSLQHTSTLALQKFYFNTVDLMKRVSFYITTAKKACCIGLHDVITFVTGREHYWSSFYKAFCHLLPTKKPSVQKVRLFLK